MNIDNNNDARAKQAYIEPELIEHGSIEEITGIVPDNPTYGCSGRQCNV